MRWDDPTIKMFLKELQALLSIECVYSPAPNPKEQMAKALGDKMMAAERTRPDVIQMSHALQSRALLEGVDLASHPDRFLKEFQDESLSDARKLSAFWKLQL